MPDIKVIPDMRGAASVTNPEQFIECDVEVIGRLPHGMTSGNSSVAIVAKLREPLEVDGQLKTHLFIETSLRLFHAADEVFQEADRRDSVKGAN